MKFGTLSRAVVAFVLLLSVVALLRTRERTHGSTQRIVGLQTPTIAAGTTQRIYAPIPRGPWVDGELVLNNNSPGAVIVIPTFFTEGIPAAGVPITLQPTEVRWVGLNELHAATGRDPQKSEGIELEYQGHLLEVGAQLTLFQQGRAGAVDVPFSMPADYQSFVQEAVWPAFQGAKAVVVLGNASDQTVFVTVEQSGRQSKQLELAARASQTIVTPTDLSADRSRARWMRLDVRGPRGAVRAAGFVETQRGFAGAIRFYDPAMGQHANLFATNLNLTSNLPIMVLKNTTDAPVMAMPRFVPLSDDGGGPVESPT